MTYSTYIEARTAWEDATRTLRANRTQLASIDNQVAALRAQQQQLLDQIVTLLRTQDEAHTAMEALA
jgi:hypothetical protein